jgi:hypothetical protein
MSLLRQHTLLSGKWCPQYRDVLSRAAGAGYNYPTKGCMVLQDRLVRNFVSSGIWNNLDYFYLHGVQGNSDLIRINFKQPTKSLSTGSPTVVDKKGTIGAITHAGFNIANDRVNMAPIGVNEYPASIFTFTTVGGGVSVLTQLADINDTTNNRLHRIGVRTTPRTEGIINAATGNLFVIENGNPSSLETIHLEVSNITGTVGRSVIVNGVVLAFQAGAGVYPRFGTLACNAPTPITLGAVGGGGGIRDQGLEVLLHTYLLEYFTALNLL